MTTAGKARQGVASLGMARPGVVRHGRSRQSGYGMASLGPAVLGWARQGKAVSVRRGTSRHGSALLGWSRQARLRIWVALVVIIVATSVPAHAEPSPGEMFAISHGIDICLSLDAHPTVPGVLGVLTALSDYGLSATESGVALASSVVSVCPIHAPLLRQFVARYQQERRWVA